MKVGELYYLEWLDHWGNSRWTNEAELEEEARQNQPVVRHVGWFVKEDKKGYYIASLTANGFHRSLAQIEYVLKGTIIKTKRLYV